MFKTIKWNTGSAATRFRHTRKKKKGIRLQAFKRVGRPPLKNQGSSARVDSPQAIGYYKIMNKKKYYYLDTINFELIAQEKNKAINLNSSVLSDATLKKVLDDIEKNLKKTNKELM